ncbi:MAG: Fumarate reductase flavoprotein subunit [Arcobacter lacus]|nr:MAG: Fumarate reductase flavoprotein subunit [Arcobacter lacus]
MKINYCDALVIGGGLAGLRVAVAAQKKGLNATVLSLVPVKRSHSAAAQGGMQASLGNSKMSDGDNEDLHFADTVKGSDWGCDQEVARMFVHTAPKAIRELASWGVPWTRVKEGSREAVINAKKTTITEDADRHGLIHSRDFGGTKKWRTCYTADATGHTMLFGVANEALKHNVDIRDRKEALSLIHEGGRCFGAVVRDLISGELEAYVAIGTCIATLSNMEAVQFHPTPIVPSGILLTEGCRGDGGILRDVDGHRFMPDYEPEKKELASRDVVSRRMIEHIRNGKGVPSPYGYHVWLDISILGREHIERNLRDVQEICQIFNGIDPADEGKKGWAPVLPMQHYSMGGIRTKPTGETTRLPGLFACGEAACWDMHGFNRLGGNSVSETVTAGMIIGNYFADYCLANDVTIPTSTVKRFLEEQDAYLDEILSYNGNEDIFKIKRRMQELMDEKVGIFRSGEPLKEAVDELKDLLAKTKQINVKSKERAGNPELEEAYRVPKMLKVALCCAKGARDRTESRGAHYREDHLKRDDANWLNRTLCSWPDKDALEPTIEYAPLDIMTMEMPPAFRGYGAKGMIIEHPDSEKRQAIVDETVEKLEAEGKDRHEVQDALMPFDLPMNYKEKNERVGDL